jgi:Fe-S-cluster containining protein
VYQFREPLVHEGRECGHCCLSRFAGQPFRAISSGVSPPTAVGEMKLSKASTCESGTEFVFSTADLVSHCVALDLQIPNATRFPMMW